mmetsp:Transcript_104136/g.333988  ORF Transcript_104136/g.333988 Transcript_104136/m.333988 type:complete len:331 (-) Transcript_104136:2301-3293(-)
MHHRRPGTAAAAVATATAGGLLPVLPLAPAALRRPWADAASATSVVALVAPKGGVGADGAGAGADGASADGTGLVLAAVGGRTLPSTPGPAAAAAAAAEAAEAASVGRAGRRGPLVGADVLQRGRGRGLRGREARRGRAAGSSGGSIAVQSGSCTVPEHPRSCRGGGRVRGGATGDGAGNNGAEGNGPGGRGGSDAGTCGGAAASNACASRSSRRARGGGWECIHHVPEVVGLESARAAQDEFPKRAQEWRVALAPTRELQQAVVARMCHLLGDLCAGSGHDVVGNLGHRELVAGLRDDREPPGPRLYEATEGAQPLRVVLVPARDPHVP